jgi:flagellar biosynthesis/type III secretory pathway protein FliH
MHLLKEGERRERGGIKIHAPAERQGRENEHLTHKARRRGNGFEKRRREALQTNKKRGTERGREGGREGTEETHHHQQHLSLGMRAESNEKKTKKNELCQ